MIYLDNNATSPVHPDVVKAMMPYFRESFGNASSIHAVGRRAKAALETAREKVAALVGCLPNEVIFTSGGSEANALAIRGLAENEDRKGSHLITTRVEHPAVLNTCLDLEKRGYKITWLDVDTNGILDLNQLANALTDQTILISVMAANNETGGLFPIEEIGKIAAHHKIPFHTDAVQAVGKIPLDFRVLNATMLSLSGHKFGAPQGIGALIVKANTKLHPLILGGAQERSRRAGTENVAGIVGLGKACELAQADLAEKSDKVLQLRNKLENGILANIPDTTINGTIENRLVNTTNISFCGVAVDSLLANLDLAGIAASAGSACSAGTLRTSHVLEAMGLAPERTKSAVRFSLCPENTEAEIDDVLRLLPSLIKRLRL